MLAGEIAYRAGRVEEGFGHLRKSIALSDNLIYAEPWGWMQPPRHAYGALQLEQGNVEEAARAYAEDLGFATTLPRALRHPNNVWALHGYHECLVKLGRTDEASMVKRDLDIALGGAEVPIESSCLCRRVAKQCC
jgi:tetratricopeptide (TPR) repeat protein